VPAGRRANAFVERLVLTARTEVTDRMLIFGQRHLRLIVAEYETHYDGRRSHRSRQLHPPPPDYPAADLSQERIKRRPVLGGLINEYERAAKKPRSGPVAEFRNPKARYDVEDLACLLRRYRLDPRDLTDLFGGALVVDFGEIGGDEAAVVRFTLCG